MKNTVIFIITALIGFVIDIVTKWLVFSKLGEFGKITLIPSILNILKSGNKGVVFGLFPGKTNAFIIFSIISIIVIVYIHIQSANKRFISSLALGLVLAGALGNLWDRFWYGYVRDFIDLHAGAKYHWPTFNVADSWICIGVAIMIIISFSAPKSEG